MDNFEKLNDFFPFFLSFRQASILQGALAKRIFRKKTPPNMFKTIRDILGAILIDGKFEIISNFLNFFQVSTLQCALGKVFFSEKSPQNNFKTCLDTFRYVFGQFWNFEFFPISVVIFESPGRTGSSFFPSENSIKTCSNNAFGNAFGQIWKFRSFSFFLIFFQVSTLHCVLAIFFRKKYLKTSSQHVWTLLGTVLDTLDILKISILSIFSSLEPPGCTEQQFYRKNFLETCSKHVWLLLGTFLGILKMWKFFQFLEVFPSFDSPGCTGHFFSEKITSKQVQNMFGHF